MNTKEQLSESNPRILNPIVLNTLWVWDVASKLVEEWFYKVKDIINIYSLEKTWPKKEITNFFRDLLDHAGNLELQLLEAIWENDWIDKELQKKYLGDYHSHKYRTLIYTKILWQWGLNALKTNLDWTEKDLFLEIILESLFRTYNLWLIKVENLINVLSYLYPEKDIEYINKLIEDNTTDRRDIMVKHNKYDLENIVYDDELYKEIVAAKKRLDYMFDYYTIQKSDYSDLHLLKKHNVAWWEKYDEYLEKWKKIV